MFKRKKFFFMFAPDTGTVLGGGGEPPVGGEPPALDPPAGSEPPAGGEPPVVSFVDSQGNLANNWRDSLPEEIRGSASLESIKDIKGLASAFVNTKKLVGGNTIKLPGENSGEAEWKEFYSKLGRPESADKYEIERNKDIPEALRNSKYIDDFKQTFYERGLNQKQVAGIMAKYDEQVLQLMQEKQANAVNPTETCANTLKDIWKDDFGVNLAKAKMAAKHFDKDGNILNGTAGNDPAVIQMLAKVADLVGGDAMVLNPNGGAAQLDTIESEMSNIRDNPAYTNSMHADHERIKSRYNMLARQRAELRTRK